MAQARKSDESVHWRIKSPNGDGLVWLIWEGKGKRLALNLGAKHQARSALADWLAATEAQQPEPSAGQDMMWMTSPSAKERAADW